MSNGDTKWQENLPESVRSWDEVTKSETPEKFWQQMTEMRSHLGQSIRVPSENASEEDHKKFHEKLMTKVPTLIHKPNLDNEEAMNLHYQSMGRPESADKYVIPTFEKGTENLDMKPVEAFKPIAHKYGLTQQQFNGIIKDMTNLNLVDAEASNAKHVEAMQSLRVDYGLKFEENIELAVNIAKNTKAPQALIDSLKIGTASADTIVWLVEMAQRMSSEDLNLIKDKTRIKEGILTPGEAKRKISEIMNNRKHPYWEKGHPSNAAAIKEVFELQKMANPDASVDLNDLRVGGVSQVLGE